MRDVSNKNTTLRTARAEAILRVSVSTIEAIRQGKIPKGDPLPVAKVAAIQAAKNTSQIIPYCHPLPVDFVGVEFKLSDDTITVYAQVKAIYKTGVEMEALTAASVAALTLYDMLKMIDEDLQIEGIRLLEKTGGKSDFKKRVAVPLQAAVLVMSDTISQGKKEDLSGKKIKDRLESEGVKVIDYAVIPDERSEIENRLKQYADVKKLDLVVTTGGTGLSPRDCTPDAMVAIVDREIPGIAEYARAYGQARTPYSMLSRAKAAVRGNTLIINLPGSPGGVADGLDALFPAVLHVFNMMRGHGHELHK